MKALLVSIGLVLAVSGGSARASAPPTPKGLVFWNTLGSTDLRHSLYGPNLVMFNCRNRRMPHFGRRCSIDVRGKLEFVDGAYGSRAATIGGGPYFPAARVHTALLRRSLLNPEHGAIDAWYMQTKDPEPFVDNPHRIFAGGYNLGGAGDVNLFVQDRVDAGHPRLHFSVFFGRNVPNPTIIWARSVVDHGVGYPISSFNNQWIHVAGVWNRRGIAGTRDTVRLYVNGQIVATSKKRNWGTTTCNHRRPGCFIDVVGCNDTCARTFAVENLRIWNYAKTDF